MKKRAKFLIFVGASTVFFGLGSIPVYASGSPYCDLVAGLDLLKKESDMLGLYDVKSSGVPFVIHGGLGYDFGALDSAGKFSISIGPEVVYLTGASYSFTMKTSGTPTTDNPATVASAKADYFAGYMGARASFKFESIAPFAQVGLGYGSSRAVIDNNTLLSSSITGMAWRVALGVGYHITPAIELNLRGSYDNPLADVRDLFIGSTDSGYFNFITVSLGLRFRFGA